MTLLHLPPSPSHPVERDGYRHRLSRQGQRCGLLGSTLKWKRAADPQNSSNKDTSQTTIDSSTKEQLAAIEKAIKTNQEGVIKKIVERVIRSDPQMHQNLKKVEA